jgi:hypothetical protein
MKRGADDCGWRQYPAPLLRIDVTDSDFYIEADVAEKVLNSPRVLSNLSRDVVRAMTDSLVTGTGWIRMGLKQ